MLQHLQLDLYSALFSVASAEISVGSTRIFYPATSSDTMPQQFLDPAARTQNVQRTQPAQVLPPTERRCYIYGEKEHYANQCPNPRTHAKQSATATPAPTCGANSIPVAVKKNYTRGRVNHVAVKEAQEAPDVVLGMFHVNATSTVVLFDSRALHSFISIAYIEIHNLPIALLKCQIIVSSP
jgi:hypothetical protein